MTAALSYREIPPALALRGRIETYWFLSGGRATPGGVEPIFPDGRPEIVLHLAQPFARLGADGTRTVQPRALLAGQIDRPLRLSPSEEADVVGIRFRPAGAYPLVGAPLDRYRNATPALADVDAKLASRLEESVRRAPSRPEARAAALDAALLVAAGSRRADARIGAAADLAVRSRGRVSVDAMARFAGLSGRSLERGFLREVGLGPKRFARIARFRAVLAARERGRVASWAALAVDLGYSDQAHLVREFSEFAGVPPTAGISAEDSLAAIFGAVSDFDKTASPPFFRLFEP